MHKIISLPDQSQSNQEISKTAQEDPQMSNLGSIGKTFNPLVPQKETTDKRPVTPEKEPFPSKAPTAPQTVLTSQDKWTASTLDIRPVRPTSISPNLEKNITDFKAVPDPHSSTHAGLILSEITQSIKAGQDIELPPDIKSASGTPLSFFLTDELAGISNMVRDPALSLRSVDLNAVNADGENCFHYLLSRESRSSEKVDRAMAAILTSGTKPDLQTLFLTKERDSGLQKTPLEFGIFLRCKSSVESCLTAFNKSQPEELAQVLNTLIEPSTTLGQKLVDKGVDNTLLISFGFLE